MTEPLLEIATLKTVIPSYSWDKGIPEREFVDFLSLKQDLSAESNNSSGVEYVGWAPFMKVDIYSELTQEELDAEPLVVERMVDFGDYYNSESNVQKSYSLDKISFCHNYVMPGLYTIKLLKKTYVLVNPLDIGNNIDPWGENGNGNDNDNDNGSGGATRCLGKHCIEWNWNSLDCYSPLFLPSDEVITWSMTDCVTGTKPKKWAYEPCQDLLLGTDPGTYVQSLDLERRSQFPFANQWSNFLCNSNGNVKNDAVTWKESIFQGSEQLTWGSISGPCLNLRIADLIWKWNFTKCSSDAANNTPLTWDETKCDQYMKKTWDEAITSGSSSSTSCEERTPSLSAGEVIVEKELVIRVKEIMPEAYIDVCQPVDPEKRVSPLTVRLSPKFSKPGSFPIEKIVWDLGDGSPLLEQKRWAINSDPPFVYSGVLKNDFSDPRNYDIVYTYNKTPTSGFSFYPSLTVYSANTYSSDCAAAIVGPIIPQQYDKQASGLKLIQNEITDHSIILLGEVERSSALWVLRNNDLPETRSNNMISINAVVRPGSIATDYSAVATYPLDQDVTIKFVQIITTNTETLSTDVILSIKKEETTGTSMVNIDRDYNSLKTVSTSVPIISGNKASRLFNYQSEFYYFIEPVVTPPPTPTPTPTPLPFPNAVLEEDLSGYVIQEITGDRILLES